MSRTPLFPIIGRLLDIANLPVLEGTSHVTSRTKASVYDFVTAPTDRSWTIHNRDDGTTEDYSPAHGRRIRRGEFDHIDPDLRIPTAPICIRPCYPLDLDVWGRSRDEWYLSEVTNTASGCLLRAEHSTGSDAHTVLTFDDRMGLLTRWEVFENDVPVHSVVLTDLRQPKTLDSSGEASGTPMATVFDD
ncbi:MAG: hypothetical protein EOP32_40870 [Rhodococcus sp. (in: high G+C Gram-positive bacteria)]|nr:MAG: hypothetical protein EOP32_40870 [Rhodococcus sp. (in: high G+C Gram-positive bacteria)]